MDGDVGQSALVGLFSPVRRLRPFVPWDMLLLMFWWGRSKGEGLYPVHGDGVFPGPVGQDDHGGNAAEHTRGPPPMISNLILSHNSVSEHFCKQHGNLYMTAKLIFENSNLLGNAFLIWRRTH